MTQDLLELVEDGAQLVRHSQFTLAVEKAQEKLKKFQLPDPRYYIAQVLQALLASGAQRIDVQLQGSSVRLVFDGPGYSQAELKNLTDAVFESGKNRDRDRIREMALGLLSVQGLKPKEVTLSSAGFRWNKNLKGSLEEEAVGVQEFYVLHRRSNTQEESILRQVAQSCRAEISINGHLISSLSGATVTSCPWPNFSFKGDGFSGAFGIAYGNIEASSLMLTRYGVVYSRRAETRIQPPLVVELEHLHLRKNASQSDVVEDEIYTQALADLQKVQLQFALKLSRERLPSYQASAVFEYLREIALQNINRCHLDLSDEFLDDLERQLLGAPLLAGANNRRYSLRELSQSPHIFYLEQAQRLGSLPSITLLLQDKAVSRMRSLFRVHALTSGDFDRQVALRDQQASTELPEVLVRRTLTYPDTQFDLVLLKAVDESREVFHYRFQGNRVAASKSLGQGKLHWALMTEGQTYPSLQQLSTLQDEVEALYLQIPKQLRLEGRAPIRLALQRRLAEFLHFKYGDLAQALLQDDWQAQPILASCLGATISLRDLRAWLEVYPQVVVSYAPLTSCREDHALLVSPAWHQALLQLLGEGSLALASLSQPYLFERTQQAGLSQAALKGVERQQRIDEDEELAAIRREIEGATQSGLQIQEDQPLDVEAVLTQLQLQTKAEIGPEIPDFARLCLQATASLKTRWLTRFQLDGLQGQLFLHPGSLPTPLRAEHLLVKIADNDPVAYSTAFLGISGWLQVPAHWTPPANLERIELVSPDSKPASTQSQPASSPWGFELGQAALEQDLLWATRRLFKFGAQYYCSAQPGQSQLALWKRPLGLYLMWDDHWALSQPESWFARAPLFSDLHGQWRSLDQWRQHQGQLFYTPLGGGRAPQPGQTLRLLAPFTQEKLEMWLQRQLIRTQLISEELAEAQLLSQLKEILVTTCQSSGCPLEPSWLDGLDFGEPSRWIVGPRKYFIQHQAGRSSTRLNPASPLFRSLFKQPENWPEQLPVLASAVYTAINRALAEVEDHHELAYLEAMLSQL